MNKLLPSRKHCMNQVSPPPGVGKVLRSIAERKLAFNQFIDEQKSKERNEARLRRQQVIINLFDIFNSNERVSRTCLKSNGRTSLA
jgi:hypothetical protein